MPKNGESEKSKATKEDVKTTQKTTKKKITLDEQKNNKSSLEKTKKETKKTKIEKDNIKDEKAKKTSITEKNKKEKKSKEEKLTQENSFLVDLNQSVKKEEKNVLVDDFSMKKVKKNQLKEKIVDEDLLVLESKKVEEPKIEKVKKKEFQTLEVVILVVLTCFISLTVGGLLGIKFQLKNTDDENEEVVGKEVQAFLKDYNYLIENYYGEVDEKELLNTAFKSIVDSLEDNYSGAIDESTSNNFDIELKGDYEGLGIEIINDSDRNILIYSIIPNSPASNADIKIGDKLLTVNNIDVTGMTTTDFIKNIVKGSGATKFTIVLERDGEQHTVEVKKEAITLKSVTSKIYNENGKKIAYLKVSIFAENTYEQFKNELEKLEAEGFTSLIIDLRDNNGGHLITVKNMISLFLDSSHVIYQTENKKGKEKVYSTGKITKKYPIVIVGNAMSASASEVMIGALTEEYGAVLIGNQTFGKGTVQELHSLDNGDEYKFTTKKWLTPKGNWVHNNGIQPKIEVTLSREYYGNPVEENDNQLRTALNYLAGLK